MCSLDRISFVSCRLTPCQTICLCFVAIIPQKTKSSHYGKIGMRRSDLENCWPGWFTPFPKMNSNGPMFFSTFIIFNPFSPYQCGLPPKVLLSGLFYCRVPRMASESPFWLWAFLWAVHLNLRLDCSLYHANGSCHHIKILWVTDIHCCLDLASPLCYSFSSINLATFCPGRGHSFRNGIFLFILVHSRAYYAVLLSFLLTWFFFVPWTLCYITAPVLFLTTFPPNITFPYSLMCFVHQELMYESPSIYCEMPTSISLYNCHCDLVWLQAS